MASKADDLLGVEILELLKQLVMFQLEMMMMLLPGTLSSPLPRHVFGLFSQTWQQG